MVYTYTINAVDARSLANFLEANAPVIRALIAAMLQVQE